MRKLAAVYCLFMGISMFGIWVMFYLTGSIPEIYTKPIELGFHIAAEIITAIILIISGIGLLIRKNWSYEIYLLSMGMLVYTLIMSPGYFAQKGELAFVAMFSVFIFIAIILISLGLLKKNIFID